MPRQPDLFGPVAPEIRPATGRSEPRLWVRRLAIWSAPGVLLREIRLRPGLNVLWAPDPADQGGVTESVSGVGHGSGKTLFCRLLRYCLGEDRFAQDEQRERVAHAFPEGEVGTEVIVDGIRWAVVRSIGTGRRHVAVRDAALDQVARDRREPTGMAPLLDAIAASLRHGDLLPFLPVDRPRDVWLLALAWLSRDQECRFDKLLDWRSADSGSGSPARNLSAQRLLDTLRALIDAVEPEEQTLREEIRALEAERDDSRAEPDRRTWEVDRLRSRLTAELDGSLKDLPSARMAVEPLRETAKANVNRLAGAGPDADATDLDALRTEHDAARRQVEEIEKNRSGVEARVPEIRAMISRMESELPGMSARVYRAEHPVCPICEVPIDTALAEGCKLSHKLPDRDEIRKRREGLRQDLAKESRRLEEEQDRRERIDRELVPARARAAALRERLRSAERARDARSDAWFDARRLVDDVDRLERLLGEQEAAQSRADALEKEIRTKRDRADAFRDAQAGVFERLSGLFNAVVQAAIGTDAAGRVAFDGNGLRASVELGGERSTAAIDSLKVVAFDLATVRMSMEGRTRLPAFLIHDSPREADLGLGIYRRLFHFVRALEDVGARPSFQYVVTTTTSPPDELRTEPWLVATLGGAAGERLLRRDL